jgi:hypothetical protein
MLSTSSQNRYKLPVVDGHSRSLSQPKRGLFSFVTGASKLPEVKNEDAIYTQT